MTNEERDGARRLHEALKSGTTVRAEVDYDLARNTFVLRAEFGGERASFPIPEMVAGRVEICARFAGSGWARQQLSNVAVDAALPEGRADRIANGYPGVVACVYGFETREERA